MLTKLGELSTLSRVTFFHRFIQLQDCPHILEVDDMDNLMMGDSSTIAIRQCPFCRKPIINTQRYKDLVNNLFANDINPIKERVYGNREQIEEKERELKDDIAALKKQHADTIAGNDMTILYETSI